MMPLLQRLELFAIQILYTNPAMHVVHPDPFLVHRDDTRKYVPRLCHPDQVLALCPVAISVAHSSIFRARVFLPSKYLHHHQKPHTQNSSRTLNCPGCFLLWECPAGYLPGDRSPGLPVPVARDPSIR